VTQGSADRVVLDVGNSAVTVAICDRDQVLTAVSVVHAGIAPEDFERRLRAAIAPAPPLAPIGIAQVNDAIAAKVIAIAGSSRRVLVAPRDFAPGVVNACENPETVGLDRLFDANALDRDGDFVVVDAGTAITVDRVCRGVFEGGAIAPGIRVSYRALHRETGKLPQVEPDLSPPPALGRNTRQAMRVGVERGLAGLVDRLVADLLAELPADRRAASRVFLTGGDARYLAPLLRTPIEIDPMLTLRGIARALLEATG
jgi:pantothenate kinase type III